MTTVLPGAAPEEIETEVTDKLEAAINTVSGIDESLSSSSESVSVIQVGFVLEKDATLPPQEVRDKVSAILSELPKMPSRQLSEVAVRRCSSHAMAISGPAGIREISEFAEKSLKRRIETINGVGTSSSSCARPRQININLDSAKLDGLGLTAADVVNAHLAVRTCRFPVERWRPEHAITLRTYGRVRDTREFGEIQVASRRGESIRVRDIAHGRGWNRRGRLDCLDQRKSSGGSAGPEQSGANPVAVVEAVKERSGDLRESLPKGWKMDLVRDHRPSS